MNNILTYNDKSVTMKRKIIDYIVMSEYLIILEDFTGDDYNLVYCFDNELHKLWKISQTYKRNNDSCGKSKSLTANLLVKNSFRMWASQ